MHETLKIRLEPRHDFVAKLKGQALWPAVQTYVAWRQAIRRAREKGEPEPSAPVGWMPPSINLDLTTACNYACPHCIDFEWLNTKERHEYEKLLESLSYMSEHGLRSVILIGGGEPTIHPKFAETVRFLKERDVHVAVVSNGSRNEVIYDIAEHLTTFDWVRLSLDSGTTDTFVRMHKPKRPITLEEICSWVPRIRERNPVFPVGFSFIITWEGAVRSGTVPIVPNIGEIVMATKLAREHRFSYISLKPFLTRHPSGSEVMDPGVMRDFENTLNGIRERVAEAETYATPEFRVIESTNLRVLLAGNWRDFTKQPHTCHMQAFRQVVSPLGVFNCPAYRGVERARIADAQAFTASRSEETNRALAGILGRFDPSSECREITCLYQPTNWWFERMIEGDSLPLEGLPEDDCFL